MDEYDAYDLSEFSVADFVHIDGNTIDPTTCHNNHATAPEEVQIVIATDRDWTRAVGKGGSGGLPQVAVEIEPATDETVVIKVAGGGVGGESRNGNGSGDNIVVVGSTSRRSPFEEFRLQTLSVSDLVGPAWYHTLPPLFLLVMG